MLAKSSTYLSLLEASYEHAATDHRVLSGVSTVHATGTPSSDNAEDKGKWMNKDRLRWAAIFNVPMAETLPEGFPVATLAVCTFDL